MRHVAVDVGTGTIVSVQKTNNSEVETYKVKDAFFKLNPNDMMGGNANGFGEKMLDKSGANFVKVDGVLHILGDHAEQFANLYHKETNRPMRCGVLNPSEPVSGLMVKELIRGVAGEAESEDDKLFFCIPATPLDADYDVVFHTESLKNIFKELGYMNVKVMNEGLSIIYAELEDKSFTGCGISWGHGMVNFCYAFMGMPVLSFSVGRGGEWIDQNAARACNETENAMKMIKEQGLNMSSPTNNKEQAISIYYQSLIDYVLQKFTELYNNTDNKDLPNITTPVDVVFAGGTSMIGGFKEVLSEKIKESFPLPINEIKQANKPLFAVANGLLKACVL